jgi:hypothetical protein
MRTHKSTETHALTRHGYAQLHSVPTHNNYLRGKLSWSVFIIHKRKVWEVGMHSFNHILDVTLTQFRVQVVRSELESEHSVQLEITEVYTRVSTCKCGVNEVKAYRFPSWPLRFFLAFNSVVLLRKEKIGIVHWDVKIVVVMAWGWWWW